MLKDKYEEIKKSYNAEVENTSLSDAYLESIGTFTRKDCPIVGDFRYGVIYLRDDCVDVLLDYIEELEECLWN